MNTSSMSWFRRSLAMAAATALPAPSPVLHVGPCVTGDGAAAGAHYNVSVLRGDVPPVVNDETEVWLDFTVTRSGRGHAVATVPVVPAPGNRAIVIHQEPTAGNGTAAARLACLPVPR